MCLHSYLGELQSHDLHTLNTLPSIRIMTIEADLLQKKEL